MTPTERQRRHQPMTKGEREDLQRLIRTREAVMKAAATQRSAELLAEFEQQLASIYAYDQDEIWEQAEEAATKAVDEAQTQIAARCEELGIPARFAPGLQLNWHGRGENAVAARRTELRNVAKSRIAAIEAAAITQIKMSCLQAQSEVLAHGLTTDAAIKFFEELPTVDVLMPPLEMASIEEMLQSRREQQRYRYLE